MENIHLLELLPSAGLSLWWGRALNFPLALSEQNQINIFSHSPPQYFPPLLFVSTAPGRERRGEKNKTPGVAGRSEKISADLFVV